MAEFDVDPVDELEAALESLNSVSSNRRGRPRIPEQWTRVISLETDKGKPIKGYELASDLMLADGQRNKLGDDLEQGSWAPHFYSKDFLSDIRNPKTEEYRLEREELQSFAEKASKIRKRFSEAATVVEQQRLQQEMAKEVQKQQTELTRRELSNAEY